VKEVVSFALSILSILENYGEVSALPYASIKLQELPAFLWFEMPAASAFLSEPLLTLRFALSLHFSKIAFDEPLPYICPYNLLAWFEIMIAFFFKNFVV